MDVHRISLEAPEGDVIARAAEVLAQGGILLYPADTCYGLGCDARNTRALARLSALKGRDHAKKFSVVARDLEHITSLTVVNEEQYAILAQYLPGPYTFVLLNADFQVGQSNTLGVRLPVSPVLHALSGQFGDAYTTTSANLSGMGAIYSVDALYADLLSQLPPERQPDLVLDAGTLPVVPSSTVVDLTTTPPTILRPGAGEFRWPLEEPRG